MSLAHAAAGASTQPTQVLQSYLALHTEVVSVLQAKVAPRLSHSGVLPVCLFLETAVGVDLNWLMVLSTIVSSRLAMGIGPFRVWDFIGILGGSYPIVLPRRAAVSPFRGLLGMHVAMCRGAISATSPCVLVLAVSSGLSVVRLWVVCLLEPSVFSAFLVFFSVRRCARWLYLLRSGAHCNDYYYLRVKTTTKAPIGSPALHPHHSYLEPAKVAPGKKERKNKQQPRQAS